MSHFHGVSPYQQLRVKLLRELFQYEHDAVTMPRREARRLGDTPPGVALRAVSNHAAVALRELSAITTYGRERRARLWRALGDVLSLTRHLWLDRLVDAERRYRATLLRVKQGIDCVRLLRQVAERDGDLALSMWCEDTLIERESLLEDAEQAMAWFATEPRLALSPVAAVVLR